MMSTELACVHTPVYVSVSEACLGTSKVMWHTTMHVVLDECRALCSEPLRGLT